MKFRISAVHEIADEIAKDVLDPVGPVVTENDKAYFKLGFLAGWDYVWSLVQYAAPFLFAAGFLVGFVLSGGE